MKKNFLFFILIAAYSTLSIYANNKNNFTKTMNDQNNKKILVLIIASDDAPIYQELQKIWRSYMHYNPKQVEAYFIKANQNLSTAYTIEGDTIWTKTPESILPGIINKTIQSMEAFLPRIQTEFDYVLRTNLSSFYAFPRLLKYLKTIPTEHIYCGSSHGSSGCSGCGYILSPDMVQLVIKNKSFFWNNISANDDDLMVDFFRTKNIRPINHARMDCMPLENWHNNAHKIPDSIFQFRIKNIDELRLKDDIHVHLQLLKMFYQATVYK